MKRIIGAFVMAMLIVCLVLPSLVSAGVYEASAAGSFKFALEDGETRYVELNAVGQADGQATGEMTLSDPVAVPVEDPDNSEKPGSPGILVRAKVDCLTITENKAVICGEIVDSNVPSEIGQRVLLVVEDNGIDGEKDRVTWGVVQQPGTWVPTDAELTDDKGAYLTWWATDAEVTEDKGIPMPQSKVVSCKTFPLPAFDFPEIKYAGGDLRVSGQ